MALLRAWRFRTGMLSLPPVMGLSASTPSKSTRRFVHKAPVVIVIANNGAWQIEVHDQTVTHGKVVGTSGEPLPLTQDDLRIRGHGPRFRHVRRASGET